MAFLGIAWYAARRIASDLETFGAKDAFIQAGMVAMFAIPAVLGAALMIGGRRGETSASR